MRLARVDVEQADRLALAARSIADALDDDLLAAHAIRAQGHVRFIRGDSGRARTLRRRGQLFRRAGRDVDVARTLNGGIQSLISLGQYRARRMPPRARRVLFRAAWRRARPRASRQQRGRTSPGRTVRTRRCPVYRARVSSRPKGEPTGRRSGAQ